MVHSRLSSSGVIVSKIRVSAGGDCWAYLFKTWKDEELENTAVGDVVKTARFRDKLTNRLNQANSLA